MSERAGGAASVVDARAGDEASFEAVRWSGDLAAGALELLDQRRLPHDAVWLPIRSHADAAAAIRDMVVRGAPAIGLAAAWGLVLAGRSLGDGASAAALAPAIAELGAARPTAVNLRWALDACLAAVGDLRGAAAQAALFARAAQIRSDDIAANMRMGDFGAGLLPGSRLRVLTICNTGSLATPGWGTALGIIRSLWRQERLAEVLACETRPYLQGARLTMWELQRDGIPSALITDNMPGHLMATGRVDAVVAGADRIAANGDVANKIGTYQLAVLARHHGIPFLIAAPWSTVDLSTPDGGSIPIEERSSEEVLTLGGQRIAPTGVRALHPAFDVTPAGLIRAIVTERGVAMPPTVETMKGLSVG